MHDEPERGLDLGTASFVGGGTRADRSGSFPFQCKHLDLADPMLPPDMLTFTRTRTSGAPVRTSFLLFALSWLMAVPVAGQEPTYELDTLLVRGASRLPGGASGRVVTLVDREALSRQPVRNVSEAIGWALSGDLQARSPAQADLSLRGASYEGVLVLVDGVRMSDPQTGHFDLDLTVPLERVERIEVLLGPASAQFGADAVGGVVNVVTRDDWEGAELRTEAGTFGRWALSGAGGVGIGEWNLGGGVERTASDGHRLGTDYRILLADGRASGPLGDGRVDISLGHGRRDFGAADFYGPFPAFERTRTTRGSAEWTGSVAGTELTPRVTFRRHTDDFILDRTDPGFYRNDHVSEQLGADVTLRRNLGESVGLAVGAEWIRETLDSNALGQRDQNRLAAFGEVSAPVGPGSATAGVRVDRREGFETFVSPSLAVSFPAGDALRLRAQAGRAFRTPTWTERYYEDPANLGTPDLEGERSWSAEAGLDAFFPLGGTFRATVFRRSSEGLIDWARPGGDPEARWRTRNVETATFDGIELNGAVGSRSTLLVRPSATWLDIDLEESEGFHSKSTLRPLVRTVGVEIERDMFEKSHVRVHLWDRTRAGEAGVFLLDARVGLGLSFGEFFLGGTNLTDASYPDVSGLPAQGRALSVGLRTMLGG
ncbi:MAG: TonB-dependent receptor [Gemmatimonadota bacterium]|nr:TonB-dependent receptor [Gemmatimonadota bacterium]